MVEKNGKRLGRITGVLLASAVAVTAIGLTPQLSNFTSVNPAFADAVKLDAPQAPNFADVVEAVSPAVVSVRIESDFKPASDRGDRDYQFDRRRGGDREEGLPRFFREHPFFRDFQGEGREYGRRFDRRDRDRDSERGPRNPRRFGMSQGSGFFVSEDGYLVTNHHVIENGTKFTVVMDDGTEYGAELIGADDRTDLAVLKVDADREFTYVDFDDDQIRVGEWVVAVGNPFGLGGTVTAGIVSAHNRAIRSSRYDDFLQIDAAVNKGNSGGPAFNLQGEVVGINTAIFSPSGGNIGIAFAIPAATAEEIVQDLIENGSVVRGWLGVQIQPVTDDIAESLGLDEASGAIVTEPQDDSPADKAGIRSGDVITAIDGEKVKNPRELARKVADYSPESEVAVTIWRDGDSEDVDVTLGELKNERVASLRGPGKSDMRSLVGLGLKLKADPDGGVVVADVAPGSSADEKGVLPGDVISSVNGEDVKNPQDVARIVRDANELGRKAALFQVRRDDNSSFVAIPLDRG